MTTKITKTTFISAANFFIDFGRASQATFPCGHIDTFEVLAQTMNTGMGVRLFPSTVTEDELLVLGWRFVDGDGDTVPLSRVNAYFRIYNLLVFGSEDPVGDAESITVTFPNGMTDTLDSVANGGDNGEGVELFNSSVLNDGFEFTDADGEDVSLDRVNACLIAYNFGNYDSEDPRGEQEAAA